MDQKLATLSANTVRVLSAEAIQKAKSGHPGMPMGCADFAFTLWYKYMRHNPKNPKMARTRPFYPVRRSRVYAAILSAASF